MVSVSWQTILFALFIMALSSMIIWAINAGAFNKGEVQEKDHKDAASAIKWSAIFVLVISIFVIVIPLFLKGKEEAGKYTIERVKTSTTTTS